MSRWYRAYEGTVTDAKLHEAAFIADVSRALSIATWHALLEGAASKNNCGSYETSARRIAAVFCEPTASIEALLGAFEEIGLIADNAIAAWSKRQFQSDGSSERVKRYRQNRKEQGLLAQWQPTKELRQFIYDRDGNACVYCETTEDLTLDHKIPEMHGGDHSPKNLQTACRKCNAQKRDLTHDEYVARRSGNGAVTLQERPHRQRTDSEGKSSNEDSPSGDEPSLRPEHIQEFWNEFAPRLGRPAIRDLTPERRQLVRARIAQYSIDDFKAVFGKCEASPFLRGDKGRTPLTFDWIMKKGNFQKTLEGNYDR